MASRGLPQFIRALCERYGNVRLYEPRKPFELILWENAAYLVDDRTRERVFKSLVRVIGLAPAKILASTTKRIAEVIREGGMQPQHRADKVRRCAEVAIEFAEGDLSAALSRLTTAQSRTLLKRFPGIAAPGADKVLLLCGYADVPAIESNGLRVLNRLGVVPEEPSYARMYKNAIAAITQESVNYIDVFALLREHGRTLCTRNNPRCAECPLRQSCPFAR